MNLHVSSILRYLESSYEYVVFSLTTTSRRPEPKRHGLRMCRGAAHASITLPDPVRRGPSLPGTSGVSDCSTMRGALLPRINRLVDFDVAGLKIFSCRNAGTSVGAGATNMDTVTSWAARGAR